MDFNYEVQVKPQHERQKTILELLSASDKFFTCHEVFEGKEENLKIIQLPLHFPIYRMLNGRTQAHQLSYISENNINDDYFKIGEEDVSVQQIQHDILKQFAKEGTNSITPIIEELRHVKKQTEAILITPFGVIVNGNRRIAAMRELFHNDPNNFSMYSTVSCAVLPPLNPQQIDDVEIRLQMRPETKLPYGWIDESLKIKSLLFTGRREDEIVPLMRKKPVEIKKILSALAYAEIYLKEWKKKPFDYILVEDGEQFFGDLTVRLKGKSESYKEANMRMAWSLFDNRENLGRRIYDFNKIIGENAELALSKLHERLNIVEKNEETTESDQNIPDFQTEFELPSNNIKDNKYEKLIQIFDDVTRREEVYQHVRDTCQTIIDSEKTAKEGISALCFIQTAHTRLQEVDLTKADPDTYKAMDIQLHEIIRIATDIKSKLQNYLN